MSDFDIFGSDSDSSSDSAAPASHPASNPDEVEAGVGGAADAVSAICVALISKWTSYNRPRSATSALSVVDDVLNDHYFSNSKKTVSIGEYRVGVFASSSSSSSTTTATTISSSSSSSSLVALVEGIKGKGMECSSFDFDYVRRDCREREGADLSFEFDAVVHVLAKSSNSSDCLSSVLETYRDASKVTPGAAIIVASFDPVGSLPPPPSGIDVPLVKLISDSLHEYRKPTALANSLSCSWSDQDDLREREILEEITVPLTVSEYMAVDPSTQARVTSLTRTSILSAASAILSEFPSTMTMPATQSPFPLTNVALSSLLFSYLFYFLLSPRRPRRMHPPRPSFPPGHRQPVVGFPIGSAQGR